MVEKCFKILANLVYDCYKYLRMLTNPDECCCESYERIANETTTRNMRSSIRNMKFEENLIVAS